MFVRAKTTFHSTYHGEIVAGDEFEVDGGTAAVWVDAGLVEPVQMVKMYYNTKVIGQEPQMGEVPLASGPVSESLLSPPAQVSRQKIAKGSKAKKS